MNVSVTDFGFIGTGVGLMYLASAEGANDRLTLLESAEEDPLAGDGENVIRGLSQIPKRLASVYVYDQVGSELFERQCETPEYYLRRVEAKLLDEHAHEIAIQCGFPPIVELGAGTALKTRAIFAEYARNGRRCDYYPIDVDRKTLWRSMHELVREYPQLYVRCLATTYETGLIALRHELGQKLHLFLGSTIGNMELNEIATLLGSIFSASRPGDFLLIGADLDKDPQVINSAYNDAAGYGPRSTLNILSHLNHRYKGNFVLENYAYRSSYNPNVRRNDVLIESLIEQRVTLGSLNFEVSFAKSELINAEIMWKFDPDDLIALLDKGGFVTTHKWIDAYWRYGLFLSVHK